MSIKISLTPTAEKQLAKAPPNVLQKLNLWREQLLLLGLAEVRRLSGWHDEPLKGQRQGQRSIRLNRQWRAIYKIKNDELILTILEVTPHDYRTR